MLKIQKPSHQKDLLVLTRPAWCILIATVLRPNSSDLSNLCECWTTFCERWTTASNSFGAMTTYIYIRTYIYIYVYVYYIHVYTCIYMYIHVYTCIVPFCLSLSPHGCGCTCTNNWTTCIIYHFTVYSTYILCICKHICNLHAIQNKEFMALNCECIYVYIYTLYIVYVVFQYCKVLYHNLSCTFIFSVQYVKSSIHLLSLHFLHAATQRFFPPRLAMATDST